MKMRAKLIGIILVLILLLITLFYIFVNLFRWEAAVWMTVSADLPLTVIFSILIKRRNCKPSLNTELIKPAKPVFSSSFIQYWYAQHWDYQRWIEELLMLKRIGVNEIIIQNIADTKNKYAVYPTKMNNFTCSSVDMLDNAMTAADSLQMKIRLGLGFNNEWWITNAFCQNWLRSEAEANKKIINEIITMYSTHPSLEGWYIPYEIYQFTALSKAQQHYLNRFLKEITSEIKSKSTKNIMISPFYNSRFSLFISLATWAKMLENILKDSGIDIVALQDSIGAGFNKLRHIDELYAYAKTAADLSGVKLYADLETFSHKPYKYASAPQSRIKEQFFIESKYVEGFVAFSINHYQNMNIPSQESDYNKYYEYYLSVK